MEQHEHVEERASLAPLFIGLLVAGAYVVAGTLGLSLALAHPQAVAIWPVSGLALVAFFVFGRSSWPVVYVGAFLIHYFANTPMATCGALAAGNTLEGLLGVSLIRRLDEPGGPLAGLASGLKFALLAALVAPAVVATLGVAALVWGVGAPVGGGLTLWRSWWLSDAAGILLFTPVLVLASLLKARQELAARVEIRTLNLSQALKSLHSEALNRRRAESERDGFFSFCPDMLCIAGFDGYFRQLNPAWKKALGFSLEELKAKPLLEFVHPDDVEITREMLGRLQAGESIKKFKNRYLCRDGRYKPLTWTGTADLAQQTIYAAAVDGTEQRKLLQEQVARAQAEKATQRLEFLANASKLLFSSLDYEDTLRRVARLIVSYLADWCAIYLVDGGVLRRVVLTHMDAAKESFTAALEKGPCEAENANHPVMKAFTSRRSLMFRSVQGSELERAYEPRRLELLQMLGFESAMITPLVVRGRALGVIKWVTGPSGHRYEAGDLALAEELANFLAIAIENAALYTDMANAQRELKDRENSLDIALTAAQLGDWDLDLVNDRMKRSLRHDQIFGYDSPVPDWSWGALMGQVFSEDRAQVQRLFEAAVENRKPLMVECRIVWPDESVHWISIQGAVYQDSSGKPVRMAGVVMDITNQKRFDEAMTKARDTALEAARTKAEFAANVSHEIRTPMNAMIGTAGLLLDSKLTPAQKRYAQLLSDSAHSLLTVINDILDFSKMEAGKVTPESLDFDLREAIQSAIDLVSPQAEGKDVVLQLEISPEVPVALRGDETRLRQVLLNLLSNAMKFTERGFVRVAISTQEEQSSRVILKIVVADSGIGMSLDQQERLFTPFMQGDASTSRKFGGTGLGLAISRRLVEVMGGEIQVESFEGRGSTFSISLPFQKRDANAAAPSNGHAVPTVAPVKSGKKPRRLLVVEDNPVNQEVIGGQLKRLGYKADIVSNGQEALNILERLEYGLVLMDCQMPELDGYQATQELRRRESPGRHAVVIGITANAMPGDREKCLAAGMDDYLPKPLTLEQLGTMLQKWTGVRDRNKPSEESSFGGAPASKSFVAHIKSLYRTQTRQNLSDIRTAISAGDAEKLQRAAHTLKGCSGQLGLSSIQALSQQAEELAASEKVMEVEPVIEKLEEEFRDLCKLWKKGGTHENGSRRRR